MRNVLLAATTALVLAATMASPGLAQGGGGRAEPSFSAPGPTLTLAESRARHQARLEQRARRLQARRAARAARARHQAPVP